MDDLDHQILAALVADARATYAEIGAVVGLSAPAVKRRVDKLLDSGVIRGFTAVVDPEVLGWSIEAMIDVYCQGRISPAELREAWLPIPEVVQASTVAGSADAVLRVRARSVAHLEDTLERVREAAAIERTESTVVLSRLIERG